MRRVRAGEIVAGVAGVALLAAMFLDWYSMPPELLSGALDRRLRGVSAWEAFSVIDLLLALCALAPLVLVAFQATRVSQSLPVMWSVLTTIAGMIAVLLVLYRLIDQPGPNELVEVEPGAWIGLVAALAVVAGGWISMRTEAVPGLPLPPIEDLPAPAP